MKLVITLTCPHCGNKQTVFARQKACRYFQGCGNCAARLRPKEGDRCVFVSYGDTPHPPVRMTADPSVGQRFDSIGLKN